MLGAQALGDVGHRVRLVERVRQHGQVVAVAVDEIIVAARLQPRTHHLALDRFEPFGDLVGVLEDQVERDGEVLDHAAAPALARAGDEGVDQAGHLGQALLRRQHQRAHAFEPRAVGAAVGQQHHAAIVDHRVAVEVQFDAAVGVLVARGGGDDRHAVIHELEQRALARRRERTGDAILEHGRRMQVVTAAALFQRLEQRVVQVSKQEFLQFGPHS